MNKFFQVGLAKYLKSYKNTSNTSNKLMFPRCHYIRNETDYDAFMEDYITTALIGALKFIIQTTEKNRPILFHKDSVSFNASDHLQIISYTIVITHQISHDTIDFMERSVSEFLDKKKKR